MSQRTVSAKFFVLLFAPFIHFYFVIILPNFIDIYIYRKPTDRQSYLHNKSYHPNSTKKGIPYSQALRIKRICSEYEELEKNIEQLKNTLSLRNYNENHVTTEINKALNIRRDDTLKYKDKTNKPYQIPLVLTYNKQLPKLKEILDKNWKLLQIDQGVSSAFQQPPRIVHRRNKNLRDLVGQTTISDNKVLKPKNKAVIGLCKPCNSRIDSLCCKQVKYSRTFKSNTTNQQFDIYHQTNCKSTFAIYILECIKCKIQYVGKAETQFSLRLNNHRKDATSKSNIVIPASKHFHNANHNFMRDAKFTIIETLEKQQKSKEEKCTILLQRENFWITKLKTLAPNGLNKELNKT